MWVSKDKDWNYKHTELSKYFIEKIKQQVDYDETISNRHKTSNGFTLISEIVDISTLTLKRKKSFKRLESLINESHEPCLNNNIQNDYIIGKYHGDIKVYYKKVKETLKDNNVQIKDLQLKSKVHLARLNNDYLSNIFYELSQIDFGSTKFVENSKTIDSIVTCLLPSLLYKGYSPTSISDIAYRMIRKPFGAETPIKFLKHFNNHLIDYDFLYHTKLNCPELKELLNYLDDEKIIYNVVNIEYYRKFISTKNIKIEDNEAFFQFSNKCIDPHNFLRSTYENTIRRFLLTKNRDSLSYFNNYFENIYWRFSKTEHTFQPSNIKIDPINIKSRKNTLIETLKGLKQSYEIPFEEELPIIDDISDSVYFYNLALGSKSIENSMMLLWSSLEAMVPYRFKNTDIENIQYFVSKSLSIGSLGRRITSFSNRIIASSEFNNDLDFKKLGIIPELSFNKHKFTYWPFWLSDDKKINTKKDPYNLIKPVSNLLCSQFVELNLLYSGHEYIKKTKHLQSQIYSSRKSIEYQLDRIYLHRNQIVHSGKFINEYSNLWLHLEWYVGKLLSYCFFKYYTSDKPFSKEAVFIELEADYDLIDNLLSTHKEKKVKEINFAFNKLFEHTWQFV